MSTNINKINAVQKNLMAEFMREHPDLAKNLLPNCVQGKATLINLWEKLSGILNSHGPPTKNFKMWRKVYADQKYQIKKKLTFNKKSKNKTGGGPFEEQMLTHAEEEIVAASGMEAAVEGMNVKTFGCSTAMFRSSTPVEFQPEIGSEINYDSSSSSNDEVPSNQGVILRNSKEKSTTRKRKAIPVNEKLVLMEQFVKEGKDFQISIVEKLDRLVAIKELTLAMKKDKFKVDMRNAEIDCKIKEIELKIKKAQLEKM